jgi:hypothetical protein
VHLARWRLPAGVTASRREERADGQPEQARAERPTEDTNVAVRFRSRRAGCTAPTRHCRSAPASEAGGSTLRVEPAPALPKRATGELVAAAPNKKILTIQIRPAKVITGVAKRRAQDCPPNQCGCVWFCLVGRVTPCAPSFRSRFTTRAKTQRQRFGLLQPFQFGSA